MLTDNIEVFISYSHDSPEHDARVLALADRLRAEGLSCTIDQYDDETPADGWPLWMDKQIRNAHFVLMICTQTYYRRVMGEEQAGKGLGARWEGNLILQHLYNSGVVNPNFVPVLFNVNDAQYIPTPAQGATYYVVDTQDGYEKLYSRLTNQPLTPKGPVGRIRKLVPRPRAPVQSADDTALEPNLVHPYPLQANFTGRVKEREELTEWLADNEHPIYELVALGGMGKSALAWYWTTRDVLTSSEVKLDGVMWWSFYEGESSFAKFVDEALKYVSGQPIDTGQLPTTYDRAQELRRLLQTKRVLFVLDGFERQLRDYASLDAAYKSDDSAKASAGARSCVDPTISRLLRDIAAGPTRAKILLTSRLTVSDLEDRAGDPLAGVVERLLKELSRDDAIIFMRAQGVKKGTDTEIANVCEGYGYHALSLRLLSGLIEHDAKMPGDIDASPRHDVHDDLVQRQHHILEQSYNALPKRERALLSRVAAFRGPITYDALAIFNTLGNEARFEAALDDLRVRGLLQRDYKNHLYDLHPIVRRYAYDRLSDKKSIHGRLHDYFSKFPTPKTEQVESLEDLAPLVELYHHTVRAGRYDEAVRLFKTLLQLPLHFRFGAYQMLIELLRTLLEHDCEDHHHQLRNDPVRGALLHDLANAYSRSGQPKNAVDTFQASQAILQKLSDERNLAIGLADMANEQMNLGNLEDAERNLRRSIQLSSGLNEQYNEAYGHYKLGHLFTLCGSFDEAAKELDSAFRIVERLHLNQPISTVWAYRSVLALLMTDASTALGRARTARKSGGSMPVERDIIRIEWLLGAALVMEGKDLNAAAAHLTDALTRCRRINLVEVEPDIFLAWARLYRARGNPKEAQVYSEEALAIADRCEYRFTQAEIHNFLALLALDAGDREKARAHGEIAKERAWCDGPPHCYKPALDEAEKMLTELGAR